MILTEENRSTGRETLCQIRSVHHRFTSIAVKIHRYGSAFQSGVNAFAIIYSL